MNARIPKVSNTKQAKGAAHSWLEAPPLSEEQINQLQIIQNQRVLQAIAPILKNPDPVYSQAVLGKLIPKAKDLSLLRDRGYLVQSLSETYPTLKSVLYDLMYGRLNQKVFDALVLSFDNIKERYIQTSNDIMFVHLYTEKMFKDFVCMASSVYNTYGPDSEQTLSFECLFTTDSLFRSDNVMMFDDALIQLFPELARDFKQFDHKIVGGTQGSGMSFGSKLKQLNYDEGQCYLLSTLTREFFSSHEELVRDYILYLPTKCFTSYDR